MAINQYCDRCGRDVSGEPSSAIQGIADADRDGNGTVTHMFDICEECYDAIIHFIKNELSRSSRLRRSGVVTVSTPHLRQKRR